MPHYETDLWRLELPDGWEPEEAPEESIDDEETDAAISFFHPDNAGVLSLSCWEKEEGFVEVTDLEELATDLLEAGMEPVLTQTGVLHGLLFEHQDDNEWWREWFLACDDLFFYITYNCPLTARGAEDAAIRTLLHRLEIVA